MDRRSHRKRLDLLLALLRGNVSDRSLPAEEGAGPLLKLAHGHGVLPRVLEALAGQYGRDALEDWTSYSEQRSLLGLVQLRELRRIAGRLSERSIPAASWKGPALAEDLYGSVRRRHSTDLDLLVPRDRVLEAARALGELGYRPSEGWAGARRSVERRLGNTVNVARRDLGVYVELHWALASSRVPAPYPMEEALRRSASLETSVGEVSVLAPADRLLAHAVHGGRHRWGRLGWLEDFARLGERLSEEEWAVAARRAEAAGVRTVLDAPVLLTDRLFESEVPPKVLERARAAQRARRRAAEVVETVTGGGGPAPESAPFILRKLRFLHASLDRRRDRWAYAASFLARPTGRDLDLLPEALAGLAPLVRPFRLVVEYGPALVRRGTEN